MQLSKVQFKCQCASGNCIGEIGPRIAHRFREAFWGPFGTKLYPSTSERRKNMRKLLDEASVKGQVMGKPFVFQIEKTTVCERGFITMLGFNADSKPKMWHDVKSRVEKGIMETVKEEEISKWLNFQRQRCRTYIISFVQRECEPLPHRQVSIVPYVYVKDFWRDYEFGGRAMIRSGQIECSDIASYDTFKRAFLELKRKHKPPKYFFIPTDYYTH
jgi:hypothetical protein